MKPKAPKKRDPKPNAKTGEVREVNELEMQFNSLQTVIFDKILKDLDLDLIVTTMKPSFYYNGLPVYEIK
jgi:hypothetical protein